MSSLPLLISNTQSDQQITPPVSFDGSRTPPSDEVRGAAVHTPPSDPRNKADSSDRDFKQLPRIAEAVKLIKRGGYPLEPVHLLAAGEYDEILRQVDDLKSIRYVPRLVGATLIS